MYILLKHDGTSFYLRNNTSYILGRRDCDITIDDNTVSRKHAKITIKGKKVIIEDLKSANKTILNGNELSPNVEAVVKVGNEIKLGTKESIFLLKKDELLVTTSGLRNVEREELKTLINNMCGIMTTTWSERCTHIVVDTLVLTVKVLCALIVKQNIVTLNYFKDREIQISKNGKLPNYLNYLPKMAEETFRKNQEVNYSLDRSRLFKNKIFVFPNESSRKKMEEIIDLAQGTSVAYDVQPIPKSKLLSTNPEYLFIITSDNTQSENTDFNQCIKYLMENKRRSIPLTEIATAILIGDCKLECNPKIIRILKSNSCNPSIISTDILVSESQTQLTPHTAAESIIVPDTDDTSSATDRIVKRKARKVLQKVVNTESSTESENIESINENPEKNKIVDQILSIDVDAIPEFADKNSEKVSSTDIGTTEESMDDVDAPSTSRKRKKVEICDANKKQKKCIPTSTQNSNDVIDIDDDSFEETSPIKLGTKRKTESSDASTSFGSTKKKKVNPFENTFNQQKTRFKSSSSSQSKLDSFFGKLPTQKTTRESVEIKEKNPFKQPESKKSQEDNPFAKVFSKKFSGSKSDTSKDNDVSTKSASNKITDSLKVNDAEIESVSKNKPDVTLNKSKKKKNDIEDILTSTRVDGNQEDPNFSMISMNSTIIIPTKWMSKPSTVSEPLPPINESADEAFQEYIESFKTIVTIDESLIVRKPMTDICKNSTVKLNSKIKNFKKFKKANTGMQTSMIMRSELKKVTCEDVSGIFEHLADDDEVEMEVEQPSSLKRPVTSASKSTKNKRFHFNFE